MTIDRSTLRQHLLEKVRARGAEKSICPSEVARDLGGVEWRSLMDTIRSIGAELVDSGEILALQRGQPVHPLSAKGPIRFKLNPNRKATEN
ncbi:MAG: DUF3253 domain-containing protein [Leptolyngbyaceae cyanobacterium SL_5_9]|nr:DUF3253 domain-containing protein [Leptolyngbyaceae cyanobacterium SL_5_9]NJO72353.1 DUF3253 domain-containing protein [Leptolyngbyaceae cyanobacterium RM1_406_9]